MTQREAVGPPGAAKRDLKDVLDALVMTSDFFKKNGVESARLEAELLLAKVLGCDRVQLYVKYDRPLSADEVAAFRELVRRRARHEPVHYILGRKEFWSLDFEVVPGVLIPRADTEVLVEEVSKRLASRKDAPLRIADVGTGTGCIAIALATELPQASVVAGDIADVPLALARKNADRLGVGARIQVVRADGLAPLAAAHGPFDVVVSNPPYIRMGDFAGLPPHVRMSEPREALVAGPDGLDVLRRLVADLPAALAPEGLVAFEIADRPQAEAVVALLDAQGFRDVQIRDDYGGIARVVVAQRKETK